MMLSEKERKYRIPIEKNKHEMQTHIQLAAKEFFGPERYYATHQEVHQFWGSAKEFRAAVVADAVFANFVKTGQTDAPEFNSFISKLDAAAQEKLWTKFHAWEDDKHNVLQKNQSYQ